jgi:hypothetical protein
VYIPDVDVKISKKIKIVKVKDIKEMVKFLGEK